MGIAKGAPSVIWSSSSSSSKKTNPIDNIQNTSTISMSHEYHPSNPHNNPQQQPSNNIFTFPNGFDRSAGLAHHQPTAAPNSEEGHGLHPVYESAGMLSEMFNFSQGPGPNQDLLDYRRVVGGMGGGDWYGSSRQVSRDDQIGGISAHDSAAAAMQLFLTNPPPKSPSPPPAPTNIHHGVGGGGFHPLAVGAGVVSNNTNTNNDTNTSTNFWNAPHMNNPGELGGIVEGQGLSLSLSSSLQHLEAAKQVEEFRNIGVPNNDNTHHIMFFNQHQGVGPSSSSTSSPGGHFFKNLAPGPGPGPGPIQPLGGFGGPNNPQHQIHLAYGSAATSSLGVVNVLRNSKFVKPAQELLEEFCSVGRGQLKKPKLGRQNSSNQNPTSSGGGGGSGGGGSGSLSATKDPPQLSPSDRIEHQRRKVKLLAMLDEVDRRYNHYCEQMQMVVNSFDLIMGYGAAIPYTALAQKAMSRHFRCLKDAVQVQLKHSCEMLGEKDPTTSSGITKGETPRLKVLEQSLRQQRAFHQMGMMDQEAWRPQRGLPERSVNILRAWLFEHFLHPYPSDADKHLLARQTGLSRNQVSNWFINARVRLWKPMIEEMYQQESKELEEEREREGNQTSSSTSNSNSFATQQQQHASTTTTTAQNPMPVPATSSASTSVLITEPKRSADTMTPSDPDPSLLSNITRSLPQQPPHLAVPMPTGSHQDNNTCHFGGSDNVGPTTMIRFGNTSGDVSLTLGLRHAGNAPEKGATAAAFSVRDFAGSC